jgi:MerR family mercuric resistance operon transcriptional regulator
VVKGCLLERPGFSLEEVAGMLVLEDGTRCDDARALAEGKLADVRTRLADLRRIEHALKTSIGRCCEHDGDICCPIFAALQSAARDQIQ